MRSHLYIVLDAIDQVLASGGRLPRRSDAALRRDCMDGDIGLLMHGSAVGHQDAIEQENTAINARFGIANRFRGLIIAIGLLIVLAR